MAKTYIEIVNEVLLDTNEVPLQEANFAASRGFHTFVKNAVNRALMDIVNESDEWPWLAGMPANQSLSMHTHKVITSRRKPIYEFPEDHSAIDWDNIIIEDMREKKTYPMTSIATSTWKRYANSEAYLGRSEDDLDRPTGIYRLENHKGFGVTPVPDHNYAIYYTAWSAPAFLNAFNDTLPFPDKFYNVLVSRARYYAWIFRENEEMAGFADKDYSQTLANMKRILIRPTFMRMRAV